MSLCRPVVATFLIQAQPVPEGLPAEKGFTGVFHRVQHFWQQKLKPVFRLPFRRHKLVPVS